MTRTGRSTAGVAVALAVSLLLFEAGFADPASLRAGEPTLPSSPSLAAAGAQGSEIDSAAPVSLAPGQAVRAVPASIGAMGGGGVAADPSVGLSPRSFPRLTSPTTRTELVDARTETSRTFANPDGTFTLEVIEGRLHYRDASGAWQPLDLSLVADAAAPYGLRVRGNDREVRFGQTEADEALARISTSAGSVALRALDSPTVLASGGPAAAGAAPAPTPEAASPAPQASPTPEPTGTPVAEPTPTAEPTPAAEPADSPAPSPTEVVLPSPAGPEDAAAVAATPGPGASPAALPEPTITSTPTPSPEPTPSPAPTAGPTPTPSPEPGPSAAPAVYTDNRLGFRAAGSADELFVRPTDLGFEFGAVLATASSPTSYAFALELNGLEAELGDDGQILLYRSGDGPAAEAVGVISPPVMLDANEAPGGPSVVTVDLYRPGSAEVPPAVSAAALASLSPSELVVTYTIDPAWLAAPERPFPVTLDPTACLGQGASGCDINGTSGNFDHFIMSALPDRYPSGWTTVRVGYDVRSDDGDVYGKMRGLLYFKDVTLPDGATVYDTNLQVTTCCNYGNGQGQTVWAYRVTSGWGQTTTWNQFGSDGNAYTTTGGVSTTVPAAGGNMNWDVDTIVQSWYTRRGKDWKGDLGFALKMASEGSSYGETEIRRYDYATASKRPLLKIYYELPKVSIDFDLALGANYAPSMLVTGQATILPVIVRNNSSGFSFTTANCKVGYRWFDAKGNLVGSPGVQALPDPIASGSSSATIGLSVTPPATVGQYTLRLDLVRVGSNNAFASDWADPSKYYSRNKKVLTSDNARWTGSSIVERDEFGIDVTAGDIAGTPRTVGTGLGALGIDLATKNLSYDGATGLGFTDLFPVTLSYGYNSADATNCTAYRGILGACGWYTNWDERITGGPNATGYDYVYQGPSGTRSLVDTDADGQLVSGAPVLLERERYTLLDETKAPAAGFTLVGSAEGFAPFYGTWMNKVDANTSTDTGLTGKYGLNTYTYANFAMRGTSGASPVTKAGLCFKIHNVSDSSKSDRWFCYTVGASGWDPGYDYAYLGGTIGGGDWAYYTDTGNNLWNRVRNISAFGSTTDEYQVVAVKVQSASNWGSGKYVYVDALRLEPGDSAILDWNGSSINLTNWSNGQANTSESTDTPFSGEKSVSVAAASYANSPECNTTLPSGNVCWATSRGGLWNYAFASWWWKKAGGTSAAITFHFKDWDQQTKTGDVTYYAGPVAPAGAPNPVQVSPTLPSAWTRVTRNILEDARQILGFYTDTPTSSRSAGPDDVRMTGFRVVAGDGSYLRVTGFRYGGLPNAARKTRTGATDEYGLPSASGSTAFTYDARATYADGSVHYFNEQGLLARIADLDGDAMTPSGIATKLDWTIDATKSGPAAYALAAIHGASDGQVLSSGTADRELLVTTTPGSGGTPTTVEFAEKLGSTTADVSNRKATFRVATATGSTYGIGDLLSVAPARAASQACGTAPNGCVGFDYYDTTNHQLDQVRDPRYTASNSYSYYVTWGISANGTGDNTLRPTAVTDASVSGVLLRAIKWDHNTDTSPLYRRPLYQDAAALAAGYGIHVELAPDGSARAGYAPQSCTSGDCVTNPPSGTSATLGAIRTYLNEYDGLARVSTSRTYRCSGTACSGCAAGELQSVTRRGTSAGNEVAWTQSSDQYFASLRDSGGANPDLYRSETTYDGFHQPVETVTPATNQGVDYVDTISSTSSLLGYWRLNETAGPTATDLAASPHNGAYTNFGSGEYGNVAGALIRGASTRAPTFDSTNNYVAIPSLGTISGSYTAESWIKLTTVPDATTNAYSFIGSRLASTDRTFDAKAYYSSTDGKTDLYVDIGNGSSWLFTGRVATFAWQAGRWYHVAIAVDDAADTVAAYVDGVLVGRAPFTTAGTPLLTDSSRLLRIGQNGYTTPEWFKGAIEETAIFSRALASTEVRGHFLAGRGLAEVRGQAVYSLAGHSLVSARSLLTNGGFEAGLEGWRTSAGTATAYMTTAADPTTDPYVHNESGAPVLSYGSVALGLSTTIVTDVGLVPGQTFRVQFFHKAASGGSADWKVSWWDTVANAWSNTWGSTTIAGPSAATSWTGEAWDLTLPTVTPDGLHASDGRVRIELSNPSASVANARFDDVAIVAGVTRSAYNSSGLLTSTKVLAPASGNPATPAFTETRTAYDPSPAHPAILATSSTANYLDGTYDPAVPDADVTSTATYDAWGRALSAVDPDGAAAPTTSYSPAGNQTDVDETTDVFGGETTMTYDTVGNILSTIRPSGATSSATYDLGNRVVTSTAPDGVVARNEYNTRGQRTSSIANYLDGTPSGASGLDDVITTYQHDEFGRLVTSEGDTGYTGALDVHATTTYDVMGNPVAQTTWPGSGGTGTARTTTSYFETYAPPSGTPEYGKTFSRTAPSGTRLPIAPTGSAPVCPGTTSTYCNAANVAATLGGVIIPGIDPDGRAILAEDARNKITRTWYDLAGRPLRVVANYVDGVYDSAAPDTDLVTTTQYDLAGGAIRTVDVLGRATETTRDALERATAVTAKDSAGADVNVAKTVYTPGGRVDRSSAPDAVGLGDAARTWTKTVYDLAGRATKTLAHYDIGGAAGLAVDSFEGPTLADRTVANDGVAERWDTAAGLFISAGATATENHTAADAVRGRSTLDVTPGATGRGVEWKLDGTFKSGRTYRANAWVKAPSGTTVRLRLGTAADPATPATGDIVGNGNWQHLATALSWTPTADRTGAVLAAYPTTGSGAFRLDDALPWDSATPDLDVPNSETVYDPDGAIVTTVAPPGVPGTDEPLVTVTTRDSLGRPTAITVNAIAGAGTSDTSNLTTTTHYDALGRVDYMLDAAAPTAHKTSFGFDRLGRAIATVQNDTGSAPSAPTDDHDVRSTFGYDALGELTAYCPAAGVTLFGGGTPCSPTASSGEAYERAWHWTYDAAGHQASEIPPLNTTVTALDTTVWTYDAGGRLTSVASQTAGGTVHRHTDTAYDGVGRATESITYAGPGTATPKIRTTSTWYGDGAQASTAVYLDGSGSASDALAFTYDAAGRPDLVRRTVPSTVTLTDFGWNADGTLASRVDGQAGAIGTSSFTYDWAKRLATVTLPGGWQTGSNSAVFGYRADGLLSTRTWNGTANPLTFTYDAAKRPTQAAKTVGAASLSLTETYDRSGNVTSEGRTFPAYVSGDAGGTNLVQSFAYDGLSRLTGSAGLASGAHAYAYDLDSNRVAKTDGSDSFVALFDRTDELASVARNGAPAVAAAFDPYGNLTSDPETGTSAGLVTYGYDLLDRTTSITAGGTTTSLALDAAGRVRSRTTGSSVDTYTYLGTTDSVLRIANSGGGGATTDSLVDPSGDRLGTRSGSTVAWLVPDLHGSVAAGLGIDEGSVSDALRYDGYGLTVAVWPTGGSPASRSWKYQGRLDLSPTTTSLYDFEARDYSPGLGSFTGLDSITGSAQDLWQLNRYLYAAADPTTLVDPDGHCAAVAVLAGGIGAVVAFITCSPEIVMVGALAVAGSTYAIQHPQETGDAVIGLGRDFVGAGQRALEGAGDAITAPLQAVAAYERAGRGDARPLPSYGEIPPSWADPALRAQQDPAKPITVPLPTAPPPPTGTQQQPLDQVLRDNPQPPFKIGGGPPLGLPPGNAWKAVALVGVVAIIVRVVREAIEPAPTARPRPTPRPPRRPYPAWERVPYRGPRWEPMPTVWPPGRQVVR